MIVIQQTAQPLGAGNNSVKILDSTGANILSDGSGQLTVIDSNLSALATANNILLNSILAAIPPATYTDTNGSQICTAAFVALNASACKYVTVYNLSTAAKRIEYQLNGAGASGWIEVGYSMKLNVTNANLIGIRQTGGEADTLYYIISN